MKPGSAIVMLCMFAFSPASNADADAANEAAMTRILVTFADPGMSSANRAGPARPG